MLTCKICNYHTADELSEKAAKHQKHIEKRKKISHQVQLSMHIISTHSMSIEQYVIITEYEGNPPRCACGCGELPLFRRGKFSKYALDHNTFEHKKKMYLKQYGEPKCKKCGGAVNFKRGKPNNYCSAKCAISSEGYGFCDVKTQETIKKNNLERYGVENNSQRPEVAIKLSESKKGKYYPPKNPEQAHINKSIASKKMWENPEYKAKISKSIKEAILNNPQELKRRQEYATIAMSNPERFNVMLAILPTRLTKLHQKIRQILELDKLNFISEQRVLRYIVDELNENKKIIIEINGDYTHANPKKFGAEDVIRLRGQIYTAAEKWEADIIRKNNLEKLGYTVFVI